MGTRRLSRTELRAICQSWSNGNRSSWKRYVQAGELANIADVNEHDVGIVLKLNRVFGADGFDLSVGLGQHLLDGLPELERHLNSFAPATRFFPCSRNRDSLRTLRPLFTARRCSLRRAASILTHEGR